MTKPQSKALMDNSIAFSPPLAKAFGVCAALLIQQIHYWCMTNKGQKNMVEGYYWSWNTTKQLAEQIGCYDERTIKRVAMELRDTGILKVGNFNRLKYDRTLWYRIDYKVLQLVLSDKAIGVIYHDPLGHFFTTHSEPMSQPIPETTTKTTDEITGVDFATQSLNTQITLLTGSDTIELKEAPPMSTTVSSSAEILANLKAANGTPPKGSMSQKLQTVWKHEVPKHHNIGMIPEFTMKKRGQFGHLAKALGVNGEFILHAAIKNWVGFTKYVASAAGLKLTPDLPEIGFMLKYVGEMIQFYKQSVQLTAPPKAKKVQTLQKVAQTTIDKSQKPVIIDPEDEIASIDFVKTLMNNL